MRRVKESNPHPEGWHGFQDRLSAIACYSPVAEGERIERSPHYCVQLSRLLRQTNIRLPSIFM